MSSELQATSTPADSELPNDLPTLKKGLKTEGVRFLQQILILRYKYKITFDADFGNKTEDAVKDFQRKHNLNQDGVVGVKTWRALSANIA
ncbi:MAG: peptidoglycan-binding protein [Iphinoe sp. HA4291-MV1]|jgi:peptidoglycan hydrolase-like protein with peptidoglycan-binding domain|nr:peptidoglycan-binding protein [Iphinoe sp. HA4291-MV1]